MELYWLFVCGYICARITADKRNGMTAWICGVAWRSHLCRAVLRREKWTERNVVKGGRVVRNEQRPPKRNERREWTDRKHTKIKHDIFFIDCNRWKGGGEKLWSFGQCSGAKRWYCAAIIHNLVIGLLFRGLSPERSEPIWWKKYYNYMLCIYSFELLFFWRIVFASCGWFETVVL